MLHQCLSLKAVIYSIPPCMLGSLSGRPVGALFLLTWITYLSDLGHLGMLFITLGQAYYNMYTSTRVSLSPHISHVRVLFHEAPLHFVLLTRPLDLHAVCVICMDLYGLM